MEQQLRFCKSPDGVRIAYASTGRGPPLVRAAHWLTHLQYDLESPIWSPWIREFSKTHTYIRYDERGCGLSDWTVGDFSFEAWIRDLETVVDAVGLERFSLLGVSQGGPVGIAYTFKHPERVERLVLCGSYARGWGKRNLSPDELEEIRAEMTLMKVGWGKDNPTARRVFTTRFMPDASREQIQSFDDLQRVSATPENAVLFMTEFGRIDVQEMVPKISVPTLVLHRRSDLAVPFWLGRELASLLPNARFVPLEGRNHIIMEGDEIWTKFLSEIRHFLGVREPQPEEAAKERELGISGWLKGPKKARD